MSISLLQIDLFESVEVRATRAMFFASGFTTAAWAAIIPNVKANTMVSDGTLGLLLLCLGVGALLAMPVAGILTSRFGCRVVLIISVTCFSSILPILPHITDPLLLSLTLVTFGAGVGATGCTMNMQAVIVEKSTKKPLMSGFHGFYSLGGIVGASALAFLMTSGISAYLACLLSAAFVLVLLVANFRGLLTSANPSDGPLFALPKGPVFLISFVCFSFFLAEGTVFDWSGVFLTEYRSMPHTSAGIGIACFSITMTIGRLGGDYVISRIGARKVVTWGGIVATLGLIMSLVLEIWPLSLLGYGLLGIGCSNIVPVMFSATGRQTYMPQSLAIPAVSTLGYFGVLAGPASVGFIAQSFTLPFALYGIALLIALATLVSRQVDV